MRRTQRNVWGELLGREPLMYEDGSRDELDLDLAAALLSNLGIQGSSERQNFLDQLLPDLGIASVDDLGGESLTEVLQGILE